MNRKWKWTLALLCVCCMLAIGGFPAAADVVIKSNMVDNCEPWNMDNVKVIRASEQQSFAMGGMTYTDALEFVMGYHGGYTGQADFNLGGYYESVSFEVGYIKGSGEKNADFSVIVDGKTVESTVVGVHDIPLNVEIPLKGARQMSIKMRCSTYTGSHFGVGNIQFVSDGRVRDVKLKTGSLELSEKNPAASLTAVVVPKDAKNQGVTWTSSNPSVVSVDGNGNVKALSAGEADITVTTVEGGFKAACHVVADMPKKLGDGDVTLSQTSFSYTGTAIKPEVTVSYQGTVLRKGTDYTVAYSGNTAEGVGTVTVTGIGDYTGTVNKTFMIQKNGPKSLSISGVTLSKTSFTYSGKECKPGVTVKVDGSLLQEGRDYSLSYSNHVNAGTAAVTVTGKGSYTGTVKKNFKIEKAAQKITLKKTSYSVAYGTKAFSLKASAKTKLTYKASNSVVKVLKGKVSVKKMGKATITVTAAESGNYKKATAKVKVSVVPKKPTVSKAVSRKAKQLQVVWKKNSSVSGYQVQYSRKKNFSSRKTKKIPRRTASSVTLKGLSRKKVYYVRVRAYKKTSTGTVYSSFSKVKKVRIK